jgi:hypothetical protein
MITPSLFIEGKEVVAGRVPSVDEIVKFFIENE